MYFQICIEGASLLGEKSCLNPKYVGIFYVIIWKDARHLATVHLILLKPARKDSIVSKSKAKE